VPVDPRYEEEVSGCTASVGILSAKKIYVVCDGLRLRRPLLTLLGECWRLSKCSRCQGPSQATFIRSQATK